jgi:hypothetical protein
MDLLLALLYHGSVNIYRAELSRIVSLTHLLKLVSIPVALSEESWTARRGRPLLGQSDPDAASCCRAVITFLAPDKGEASQQPLGAGTVGAALPSSRPPSLPLQKSNRAHPPNILLSSSRSDLSNTSRQKNLPIVPKLETVITSGNSLPVFNSKRLTEQLVVVSRPQLFSLCGNGVTELEMDPGFGLVRPAAGGGVVVDDDLAGGVGDETEIAEIEIFLNGNGEVERMEVCQNLDVEEGEEEQGDNDSDDADIKPMPVDSDAASTSVVQPRGLHRQAVSCLSSDFSQPLDRKELSVMVSESSSGAVQENGFIAELGREEKLASLV